MLVLFSHKCWYFLLRNAGIVFSKCWYCRLTALVNLVRSSHDVSAEPDSRNVVEVPNSRTMQMSTRTLIGRHFCVHVVGGRSVISTWSDGAIQADFGAELGHKQGRRRSGFRHYKHFASFCLGHRHVAGFCSGIQKISNLLEREGHLQPRARRNMRIACREMMGFS